MYRNEDSLRTSNKFLQCYPFNISSKSCRLLYPKFSMSKIINNNFVFNASKMFNYLHDHDVPYYLLSI